jgi:hypothetical protein
MSTATATTTTTGFAYPLPDIGEKIKHGGWLYQRGWTLQNWKLRDPQRPSDEFLTVIMCSRRTGWSTWFHNSKTGTMSHGHIFTTESEAHHDFAARGFGGAA